MAFKTTNTETTFSKKALQTALNKALASHDVNAINGLISANISLQNLDINFRPKNKQGDTSFSLLYYAIMLDKYEFVQKLLRHKVEITFEEVECAVVYNRADILNLFFEQGVSPNWQDHEHLDLLYYAAVNGSTDCVQIILDNKQFDIKKLQSSVLYECLNRAFEESTIGNEYSGYLEVVTVLANHNKCDIFARHQDGLSDVETIFKFFAVRKRNKLNAKNFENFITPILADILLAKHEHAMPTNKKQRLAIAGAFLHDGAARFRNHMLRAKDLTLLIGIVSFLLGVIPLIPFLFFRQKITNRLRGNCNLYLEILSDSNFHSKRYTHINDIELEQLDQKFRPLEYSFFDNYGKHKVIIDDYTHTHHKKS